MQIALVEAYFGGSHKAWADGYRAASEHDVWLVTHSAQFWKWRMQGASATLAQQLEAEIDERGKPDVLLVSSMVDVAAFAGAVRHFAAGVPIAVYFHESQFTYPLSPADTPDQTYRMKNWTSAAAADLVIFNSEYHKELFRDESKRFLNSFPDHKHVDMVDEVVDGSIILPVGIDDTWTGEPEPKRHGVPLIVWNQRWEHDKGPDELLAIVRGLIDTGIDFQMAMCGQVFVSVPQRFAEITAILGDRLIQSGWADRDRYVEILRDSRIVLSTADQEFFGIGITEAVAAGASPVFPDRLVYPERILQFGADSSTTLFGSPSDAVEMIVNALKRDPDPDVATRARTFQWEKVAPLYDEALVVVAADPLNPVVSLDESNGA